MIFHRTQQEVVGVNEQHHKAASLQKAKRVCLRESLQLPTCVALQAGLSKCCRSATCMGQRPKKDKMNAPQAIRYKKLLAIADCCMASVCRRKPSMGNVLNRGGENFLKWKRKSGINVDLCKSGVCSCDRE